MILLECPNAACNAKHLVHARRASRGLVCRCGTVLEVEPFPKPTPSPEAPEGPVERAEVVVAEPARAPRLPLMVGGALLLLGGLWFGATSLFGPARAATHGAIDDVLDTPALQSSLPMVVSGFEYTERGGGRHVEVVRYGTGFVVSRDGMVLTARDVVRDVFELQDVGRDEHTFLWFARNVLLERRAAAMRQELARLERTSGDASAPDRIAELRREIAAIESNEPAVLNRCSAMLRERWSALEPKVWLIFRDPRAPLEATRVFVSEEEDDVAVVRCERTFDRFFRLRKSLPTLTSGTRVRAYGYTAEPARSPIAATDDLDDLLRRVGRLKSPRDAFDVTDDAFTVTQGLFGRATRYEGADGAIRLRIEHDARIRPGGLGGPLLDESAAVVGVNTFTAAGDACAHSLPHLYPSLSAFLTQADWVD